jgi:hypothetical protein
MELFKSAYAFGKCRITGCPDFRRKRLDSITASVLLGMERNPHRDDLAFIFQGGISAVFRLRFVAAARLRFFPEAAAEVASMKSGALCQPLFV